ncbi:MAG: ECF RNA polymerase sigma factor SigW [Pelotomaculum sp. PtaB.Bin013]|uniref:RNA polymerase sigma factor n=1 Tax=Pelotomaculum isophthalicicum JI TaxID=947010 RepID=A0A9X4JW63_9FIRM|nr:RNA polymerase sigma factor [Pelotomaculum isophthalicicum]MDF9408652.1 RNA polymerase sigma factor [Pelotomaculum isophthalicicum JI]OPX91242.1 MAG: ECF RNA polymerase sigma factor SigW [Pelotomaculum sp. PtaB.Bin013]
MDANTDHNLIIRCREGDEGAWRLLLARYEAYVYRLCYRIGGSSEDALDLTQEALVKVLTGLDSFQPGRPFKPWLRKVTVNACLNYLRRRVPDTVSLEQPVAEDIVLGDTIAGNTGDPEHAAEWRDAREVLQQAMSELSYQQRAVLMMRHQEGLSYEEIAAATGLPPGTVKTCLFRARQQLKRKLASVYGWE